MKTFIIGPGGVGKSTSGKILAQKLEYELIDLDMEFMKKVGHIGTFIDSFGYEKYARRNSELFYSLLTNSNENTIFVLSSGLLVHKGLDSLVNKHAKTLTTGISLLLLPSKDINEAVDIVAKRQINRGLGLNEEHERKKIQDRYVKYLNYGDIKIFSHETPESIAEEMSNKLANR